jgi:Ca2+/H+ antiporter, TMEM165/GDT1 family
MGHWLLAFASAFAAVFVLELPDKTTALTIVLASRFPSRAVLAGAAVAFAVQSVLVVALGSAITLLPDRIVAGTIAVLFAVGAVLLFRESLGDDSDADGASSTAGPTTFLRAAAMSFGMLALTELGDASQITGIGVAARYASPIAVGLGYFAAMMSVSLLALFVGRKLRDRVPTHFIQRGAAAVFAIFAAIAAWQAITG